ncbi:MAG: hypothetical protein WAW57_15360 [Lutibacter sp.]
MKQIYKIMRIFLIILLSFLLIGCKSNKNTVETHSTDTIRIEKIIKITPAQLNNLVIESPCDSLGNLKPFNYSFGSENNKTTVKTLKNTIVIEQNLDSLKSVWEKEYKASTFKSEKVEIIYKTPNWNWKIIAVMGLIIILLGLFIYIRR